MKILNIIGHHSGGLGNNNEASTLHLTVEDIAKYHKYAKSTRTINIPSKYINGPLKYGGYTTGYDPKTRIFYQFRAIGEQTAAQKGHNFDSHSHIIIGNYNQKGWTHDTVDPMTEQIEKDNAAFLHDLINGNKRNLIVVPGTILDFSIKRVYPHRFFSQTDCNGNYLEDSWLRDLVIKYKKPFTVAVAEPTINALDRVCQERNDVIQILIRMYVNIFDQLHKEKAINQSLGSVDNRECDGFYQ